MDSITTSHNLSNTSEENVINILVIQQDDFDHGEFKTQIPVKFATSTTETMPDIKLEFQDSTSCILNSHRSKSHLLPRQRLPLYKSQSFTVTSNMSGDEENSSEVIFNDFSFQRTVERPNLDLQSSQPKHLEMKSTPCIHQQDLHNPSFTPVTHHLDSRTTKLVKHKSVNIPVNPSRSLALSSPLMTATHSLSTPMLLRDLNESSIKSLTTTPDSGFCTPSFENATQTSSLSVSLASAPRSSDKGTKYENVKSATLIKNSDAGLNEHLKEESPLDISLESVQWLGAYSIGDMVKPLITSPPVAQVISDASSDEVCIIKVKSPPVTRQLLFPTITPLPVIMTPTMPKFNMSVLTIANNQCSIASSSPHKRKALEELELNKIYGNEGQRSSYERPIYSYMDLIKMALKDSEDGQMTLREIQSWIENHFPYFKHMAKQSWKSSVRHNLSLHSDFIKVEDRKHGGKWKLNDDAKEFTHRLPKPSVVKLPVGPKVPAFTPKRAPRSALQPILPKATGVSYALVPIPIASLGQPTIPQILQQHLPVPFPNILAQQHQSLKPLPQPHLPQEGSKQAAMVLLSNPSPQQLSSSLVMASGPSLLKYSEQSCSGNQLGVSNQQLQARNAIVKEKDCCSKRVEPSSACPDFAYKPLNVDIHRGSTSSEKKIIVHLKQTGTGNSGSTRELSNTMKNVSVQKPLKGRAFHKSIDKLQRSSSFDARSPDAYVRPRCRGKRTGGNKKAPVLNLEGVLKGAKRVTETASKMSTVGAAGQGLNIFPVFSSGKVEPRPLSAPSKSLIEQAWDQAGSLTELGESYSKTRDSYLVDQYSPASTVITISPLTKLKSHCDKKVFCSSTESAVSVTKYSGRQMERSTINTLHHDMLGGFTNSSPVNSTAVVSNKTDVHIRPRQPLLSKQSLCNVSCAHSLCSEEMEVLASLPAHDIFRPIGTRDGSSTASLSHSITEKETEHNTDMSPCSVPGQTVKDINSHSQSEYLNEINQFTSLRKKYLPCSNSSAETTNVRRSGLTDVASFQGTSSFLANPVVIQLQSFGDQDSSKSSNRINEAPTGKRPFLSEFGEVNVETSAPLQSKFYADPNKLSERKLKWPPNIVATAVEAKAMSASKLIFSSKSHPPTPSISTCASIITKPSNTSATVTLFDIDQMLPTSDIHGPPYPRFYRTKSRRKQVHVPLRTEVSPYRLRMRAETHCASAIDMSYQSQESPSTTDTSPSNLNLHSSKLVTPPCGADISYVQFHSERITSSPNSENIPPLDFTHLYHRFLQSSPHEALKECDVKPRVSSPSPSLSQHHCHSFSSPASLPYDPMPYSALKHTMPESKYLPVVSSQNTVTDTLNQVEVAAQCAMSNFSQSSPPNILSHSPNTSLRLTPSRTHTWSHFLSLISTPPAGGQGPYAPATPTCGTQLPELFHIPANSSGSLDNSFFDNLESFMHNSFSESKPTP